MIECLLIVLQIFLHSFLKLLIVLVTALKQKYYNNNSHWDEYVLMLPKQSTSCFIDRQLDRQITIDRQLANRPSTSQRRMFSVQPLFQIGNNTQLFGIVYYRN